MQKALTVSLVIPVYNEEHYLKSCLDAVAAQTSAPDDIVIVDNNSHDKTIEIAGHYHGAHIVQEARQGVLFASRRGYDEVASDIICRIDADTVLEPSWIADVRAFFDNNPDVSAITGNCYFYDFPFRRGFRMVHHAIYYGIQKYIAGTEILWGSNMAMRASAWRAVRNQCLSRSDIHEDIDLSLHLKAHNLVIRRLPKLMVGVSLLRGNLSPGKAISYLWPWPHTYWVNGHHLKAIVICIVLAVIWLVTLPLSLVLWIIKKLFIAQSGDRIRTKN